MSGIGCTNEFINSNRNERCESTVIILCWQFFVIHLVIQGYDVIKTLSKKLTYLVLIIGYVSACAPATTYPAATPTSASQIISTAKLNPTSTVIPTPSPIILDLNLASVLPSSSYKEECINVLPFNSKTLQDFSAVFLSASSKLITVP